MPKVPTYDEPQVEPRALPAVRQDSVASPALFAGEAAGMTALGAGLLSAGSDFAKIAANMQEREDITAVLAVEAKRKEELIAFDAQMREQRKGDKAKGVTQDVRAWWDERAKEDYEALKTDRQRELYKRRISPTRLQSLKGASDFEVNQSEVALDQASKASVVASINSAAANPTPSNIAIEIDNIRRVNGALARRRGWAEGKEGKPGVLDVVNEEDVTKLHEQVLRGMVDTNPVAAKAYFEANKAQIAGSRHDEINKLLKVGGAVATAQKAADYVLEKGMTEADALAYVRGKYEGEERTRAEHEIKVRYGEGVQQREREQRTQADVAWQFVARGQQVPAAVLTAMDGRDVVAIRDYIERKSKPAPDRAVKTDFSTLYELRKLYRDSPEKFRQVDLRRYTGLLSSSDLEEFAKLQTAKPEQQETEAGIARQFTMAFRQLNWRESSDKERMGNFEAVTRQAINDAERASGKKLDAEGRQKIIDRMMIQGDVNGPWYLGGIGGTRRFYEAYGLPEARRFVPDIPKRDREQIIDAATRRGRKLTEAEIMQKYRAAKGLE